jgi:transcriptional regulator with XRE-family HTH domain
MTVGTRIKELRDALGDSNAALARRLQTDDAYSARQRLSTYLNGRSEPGLAAVEMIAQALQVPAAYFFTTDPALASYILAYAQQPQNFRQELIDLSEWAMQKKKKLPGVVLVRSPRRPR